MLFVIIVTFLIETLVLRSMISSGLGFLEEGIKKKFLSVAHIFGFITSILSKTKKIALYKYLKI